MSRKTVFLIRQGLTLRLRAIEHDSPAGVAPDKGRITGFSRQSRIRFLSYLNSIDWTKSPDTSFLTLTYPDSIDVAKMRTRRNHRNLFFKRIERTEGRNISAIWRQEWIVRKSGKFVGHMRPHYHLMIFGEVNLTKEQVLFAWQRAINYDEPDLQVDIKNVTGEQGAIRYIAKYVAKNDYLDIGSYLDKGFQMGRFWGVVKPAGIPRYEVEILELTSWRQLERICKMARGHTKQPDEYLQNGFTLYGSEPAAIFDTLKNTS